MPSIVEPTATIRLEIPQSEFNKYIQTSNPTKTEEPTWAATVKGAIVTAGLLAVAGYAVSQNWESIYMAGANSCFNRVLTQCAQKLVNQAFDQTSALPLIGPGSPRIFETITTSLFGAAGKLASFAYDNPRVTATAISVYSLVKDSLAIQFALGTILAAAVITPVKYTASAMKAAVWPKNGSSTTVKVVKVAALAAVVLAGFYAAGYLEQMQKLAKEFTCPKSVTIVPESVYTNGTQALSYKTPSDIATATPSALATAAEKFGALVGLTPSTPQSEIVQQVKAALQPLAEKAKLTEPTFKATEETFETIGKKIGDAAIVHNIWLAFQNIALPAAGAVFGLGAMIMNFQARRVVVR